MGSDKRDDMGTELSDPLVHGGSKRQPACPHLLMLNPADEGLNPKAWEVDPWILNPKPLNP